jgi:hypothetical protein
MANLRMIKRFNQTYGKDSQIHKMNLDDIPLNESFNSAVVRKFANLGCNNSFTKYFINRQPADLVFLFIDICSFSTRFEHLDVNGTAKILNWYYDLVIPIIYKYGGEIDKIIGDGIICVFGPPFLSTSNSQNIEKAEQCAKEIIEVTNPTDYYSKIAMHFGNIVYYNNTSVHYEDYTVVGKPITELFRLEGISIDKRLNYYGGVAEINNYHRGLDEFCWVEEGPTRTGRLKGVSYPTFYSKYYSF